MTKPITIQSFWRGRPLSNVEILCVKSFLAHGHDFCLWAYDEVKNLPAGARVADAREVLPEAHFFVNQNEGFGKGSPSPFSDLFRMALLARYGGWWTDMDVICLRPWDIPQELVIASSDENQWGRIPNANVLRSPAGHAFPTGAMELLQNRDPAKTGHVDGPHTVQRMVREHHLEDSVVPHWWFNPIQWRYTKYLIRPEEFMLHPRRLKRTFGITERLGRVHPDSYAVHLWGEMWTANGFDRNASYHPDSLFESLKRRHGVVNKRSF